MGESVAQLVIQQAHSGDSRQRDAAATAAGRSAKKSPRTQLLFFGAALTPESALWVHMRQYLKGGGDLNGRFTRKVGNLVASVKKEQSRY